MLRTKAKILVVIISLIFLGISVATTWRHPTSNRLPKTQNLLQAVDFGDAQATLVVEPMLIDLGERPVDSPAECEAIIRNEGDRVIMNVGTFTSCTCLAVVQPDRRLSPGSSTSFRVQFTVPKKPGLHTQTIFITSDEPKVARAMLKINVTGVLTKKDIKDNESGRLHQALKPSDDNAIRGR